MSDPLSDPRSNTPASAPTAAAPAANTGNPKRRIMMTLLTIAILIAAVAYAFYYFMFGRFYESTDDAYVNGNVIQITPQVLGTVIAVNADDTQIVKAGDPLVVLDPADSKKRKPIWRKPCAKCARCL
jgi:membrane fusion protein (multidrug efflux system)